MTQTQPIKYRILLVSILSILSVLIILVSNYKITVLNHQKENQLESLTELTVIMGKINSLEKDFLSYETINPKFHLSGISDILHQCNQLFGNMETKLKGFSTKLSPKERSKIKPYLDTLSKKIRTHQSLYALHSKIVLEKGFENYGAIGQLRKEAHYLEEHLPFNSLEEILLLRRHEKDYFLRKQSLYATKTQLQINNIRLKINALNLDPNQKNALLRSIKAYELWFNQITQLNQKIGIKPQDGLQGDINKNFGGITNHIDTIKKEFKQSTDHKIKFINLLNLSALIILVIVIGLSIAASRKIGLPVERLTESIQRVIENDFGDEHDIYLSSNKDEINRLGVNTQQMLQKIRLNKKELTDKQLEIQTQNELLQTQTNQLDITLNELNLKNKNLTASINYAKRLQEAILPEREVMRQIFPNHFVLYQPRDIVSGDYYTVYEKCNKKIIISIDCTGHGVPGAFMTMLASMVINDYMRECDGDLSQESLKKCFSPKNLLEKIDEDIRRVLKQEKTLSRDGMDMSVVAIDNHRQKLIFCGAQSPLIVLQNGELKRIKGSKRTVGGLLDPKMAGVTYQQHEIDLVPNTRFYLFSDGFQDQFGGINDQKFTQKKMRNLMMESIKTPIPDQHHVFETALEEWMNPDENTQFHQIDDIMVLGFEV